VRPRRVGVGTIDGIVTDTTLVPIEAANVTILSSSVRVETSANGRFRLLRVPEGQYLLIVRRLGFRPVSGVIEVAANDTTRLAYSLERVPQALPGVVVTEERRSFWMMQFDDRRRARIGEFMTGEQIERHNYVYATELLRLFTAVGVTDAQGGGGGFNHYAVSRRGGSAIFQGSKCWMTVLVDGVMMPAPFSLDLLPSPKDLAGIEAYAGPATVPAQYAIYDHGCGMLLVWTRQGGELPH
jgi:hypothetical protein